MELDTNHLQYIVEHVFLPPKLPQTYDKETEEKDGTLYRFVAHSSQRFLEALIESAHAPSHHDLQCWEKLVDMLHVMANIHQQHQLSKEELETALDRMIVGDVLPLHIAAQNAGVIFRKLGQDWLTFESFELSLPTEVISGTVGKVIQRFPTNPRLVIVLEAGVTSTLANVLSYLSHAMMDDAIPTTKKGGSSHHETRQTVSPRYITEALAGSLRACHPDLSSTIETPYIHKRINDHVLWKASLLPWRRTPSLLLIKVALESTISEAKLDDAHGYKSFWAFTMGLIMEEALKDDRQYFSMDLLHCMNVRLARRLAKLSHHIENDNVFPLKVTSSTVHLASKILEIRWKQIQTRCARVVQWTEITEVPEGAWLLRFPHSQEYLRAVKCRRQTLEWISNEYDDAATLERLVKPCAPRLSSTDDLPSDIPTQELDIALFDFESWVRDRLRHWSRSPPRSMVYCQPILSILEKYKESATAHYVDDPERLSLMYLCILELWISLDEIVCRWCPLVAEYSPEIPEGFLDPLLLPKLDQLKRLHKVQLYLRDRHQVARNHGNRSVFDSINSPWSFANRFFGTRHATPLKELQTRIQNCSQSQKQAKLKEMDEKNAEYHSIMHKASPMTCEAAWHISKHSKRMVYSHAVWQCEKCQLLNQATELSIEPFEEPLPEELLERQAVLFELKCPLPIAIWRQATVNILSSNQLYERNIYNPTYKLYPLDTFHPLVQFFENPFQKECLPLVGIASSTKPIHVSHYSQKQDFPTTADQLLKGYAGNFKLCNRMSEIWLDPSSQGGLRPQCTLPTYGPYRDLQQYFSSTDHFPNEVISAIGSCPSELPISEYIAYGQLRSGTRIQWWNIMRAIRSQSLTFSAPSVTNLVLQSIWQAECMGDAGSYREAHYDLQDQGFGFDVASELISVVQRLGSNWKQYLYLSVIVALASRLLEFSPHAAVQEKALEVIRASRALLRSWITALSQSSLVQSEEQVQCSQPSTYVHQSIASIATIFRFTFDNPSAYTITHDDAIWFVYTGILVASNHDSQSEGWRLLQRRDQRIALRIEPFLADIFKNVPSLLHEVASLAWSGYVPGMSWLPLPSPAVRWWTTVTKSHGYAPRAVHLNILDGTLLIDGKLSDRLPAEYVEQELYSALFGNHIFFNVRPSTMQGMAYQASHHNSHIHFGLVGSELVIRRCRDTEVEEYLSVAKLCHDLPNSLTTGHHFWYIEAAHMIEIRGDTDAWVPNPLSHWTAKLGPSSRIIYGQLKKTVSSGEIVLLDPHSALYRSLTRTFFPLEPEERGLLITKEPNDALKGILIKIPRQKLSFQLSPSGQLECQSLPGYIVSHNREKIGCLFGLDTFISLRPGDHRQKTGFKILVPRGLLTSRIGYRGHPDITIEIEDHGGYFVYDIDDLVGRLVGNRTIESDLYLVKLHAYTSSPFPDPLTQRSGTHEALDRLQTASCFSTLDISADSRKYLEDIAALTPMRATYPPHLKSFTMETVEWNYKLPPSSQHCSFRTLVQAILHDWQQSLIFHGQEEAVKELDMVIGMDHFSSRAALRSAIYSPESEGKSRINDLPYNGRDSLVSHDSQMREKMAFQAASFTKQSSHQFPICKHLASTVMGWENVHRRDEWHWSDIHQWLRAPCVPSPPELWCTLFELCRGTSWPPPFEVIIALGMLGFSGIPADILASLVTVIRSSTFKSEIYACPSFLMIELEKGSIFNRYLARDLLNDCAIPIASWEEYQLQGHLGESEQKKIQDMYDAALREQIEHLVDELEHFWMNPNTDEQALADIASQISRKQLLNLSSATFLDLQQCIIAWWQNRAFLHHIALVQDALNSYYISLAAPTPYHPTYPKPSVQVTMDGRSTLRQLMSSRNPPRSKVPLTHAPVELESPNAPPHAPESATMLDSLLSRLDTWALSPFEKHYLQHLRRSVKSLTLPQLLVPSSAYHLDTLTLLREESWKTTDLLFGSIKQTLSANTTVSKLSKASGVWPDVTPNILLRFISAKKSLEVPAAWRNLFIHFAICVHSARKFDRILENVYAGIDDRLSLERHYQRNWDPLAHPDWILFEIDSGMTIRGAQAELALQMISPDSGRSAVMQLNMGEGKSSVIVPIVAATIGATRSVLPRVIVPRAQTKQQFQFLRSGLTSLCDRHIVYLPFKRQLEFTTQTVKGINSYLHNLTTSGGIWLCEPEQILSLKLLGLDKMLRSSANMDNGGNELLDLQLWLHNHSQDIIDESDEVLQTRQQVIYTVGTQRNLDASPRRWEVIQRLLHLLQSYLLNPTDRGNDLSGVYVETSNKIAGFPHIRIQSEDGRKRLERFIRTTFEHNEWSFPQSLKASAIDFIVSKSPSEGSLHSIEAYCMEDPHVKDTLLILRGMISHDILLHGLKDKRWRVEYGTDLRRSHLAVPYRAKDFPSPRSEFGHPDVTILLTCLSYYYGGLDDGMLRQAMKGLLRSATPDLTYTEWIKPCGNQIPKELQTFYGINLDDNDLLSAKLSSYLRHNKIVIDFYLNTFVFPKEAKEFPHKLTSSGWDLAAEKAHVTTGFSGTNDSRFLLPTPISQVDRPTQLHTNAKVLSRIILEENKTVIQYPDEYKSTQILDRICERWDRVTVILDVGAQILDSSNYEFSSSWLARYEENSGIDAVVFFDDGGNLSILTRDGSTVPFLDSPYASTLDHCLVYLDEAHTRGTDLRLPRSQALVTLGPRLTKDKLVQGCMRMRRLGDLHTLLFMASEEVIRLISNSTGCPATSITSTEVLLWTMRETWRQAQADLPAWVQQGKSFMQRDLAWKDISNIRNSKRRIHSSFCEVEVKKLEALYGIHNDLKPGLMHGLDLTHTTGQLIARRYQDFGALSFYDATMLEELEVELMHEKEMEREVQVIPSSKPAIHSIHPDVRRLIDTGFMPLATSAFLSIREAFAGLSIRIPIGFDQVFSNIKVTHDFYNTVILQGPGAVDYFLRPVEWAITSTSPGTPLVAFSPYEVNELLPQVRASKSVRLHMFAPRGNLFMQTFEGLDRFILPSNPPANSIPRQLSLQLNLFSGSLYLRDYATYKDMCSTLRLHFGNLPPHLDKPEIINLCCYVKDHSARLELGMSEAGFSSYPLPFFRKLLVLRRYGQSLGPSHMGKLLYGNALHKVDFEE